MWSSFYFYKKNFGLIYALRKYLGKLISEKYVNYKEIIQQLNFYIEKNLTSYQNAITNLYFLIS